MTVIMSIFPLTDINGQTNRKPPVCHITLLVSSSCYWAVGTGDTGVTGLYVNPNI